MLDRFQEIPYRNILIDLTIEDAARTSKILDQISGGGTFDADHTRGHHYKGVE